MTRSVIDRRDRLDAALRALRGAPTVDVGILDPDVAVYAVVHEFGSVDGHTPARRWLTSSIESNSMPVESAVAAASDALLRGIDPARAIGNLGADVADIVRAHLESGNFPPALKPATVRRKGHSKQMIDSGTMQASVTHRVNK